MGVHKPTGIQAEQPVEPRGREDCEELLIDETENVRHFEEISKPQSTIGGIGSWTRTAILGGLGLLAVGGGAVATKYYGERQQEAHNQRMAHDEMQMLISTVNGTLRDVKDDLAGKNNPKLYKDDANILKVLERSKNAIDSRIKRLQPKSKNLMNPPVGLLVKDVQGRLDHEIVATKDRMQKQQGENVAKR